MLYEKIKDEPIADRLSWYADDIMQIAKGLDDVMTQIDHDESKETLYRNIWVLMLALQGVACSMEEDEVATRKGI